MDLWPSGRCQETVHPVPPRTAVAAEPVTLSWAGRMDAAVLSDNGRESCRHGTVNYMSPFSQPQSIAYEATRVDWPPSDGMVERLHRRLLDEAIRVRGSCQIYPVTVQVSRYAPRSPTVMPC